MNYEEALERLLDTNNVEELGNYQELQKAVLEGLKKAKKYDELIKEMKVRKLIIITELKLPKNLNNISKLNEYKVYDSLIYKRKWITKNKQNQETI